MHSEEDARLVDRVAELRVQRKAIANSRDEKILLPAFACAYEAARRVLGIEFYNSQLLGGLALARGCIAEMQTGEGKTFTALIPAVFYSLGGNGVHLMTVNDYLAERDFELLKPVYELLGISVGFVGPEIESEEKRAAYRCDVTYGPGCEFGFDYLRDQAAIIARKKPRLGSAFRTQLRGESLPTYEPIQRARSVAIVDEADSVMIDEATTPLILATGGDDPAPNAHVYLQAKVSAALLTKNRHYVVDESKRSLHLTAEGVAFLKKQPAPRKGLDRPWRNYVEQALRADLLHDRDVYYVVADGEVQIVDQNTGRIFKDRSWKDGLHQAVQAKENVDITCENRSLARITRQRFFQLYDHVCGMTGTAKDSQSELRAIFKLEVVVIDPNKPCLRQRLPTRILADAESKFQAIIEETKSVHSTGQPVLIGTAAIEQSEAISKRMTQWGIAHELLNGKQDADEADIVSRAGVVGAVTIATNMAGRGTDIKLGPGAAELGGLHVIAVEPQESTRVDRQLVGRSARQGDPGSCRLYTAPDDSIFQRYEPNMTAPRLQSKTDIDGYIRALQQRIERTGAEHRRQMYSHDDWLEKILRNLV